MDDLMYKTDQILCLYWQVWNMTVGYIGTDNVSIMRFQDCQTIVLAHDMGKMTKAIFAGRCSVEKAMKIAVKYINDNGGNLLKSPVKSRTPIIVEYDESSDFGLKGSSFDRA